MRGTVSSAVIWVMCLSAPALGRAAPDDDEAARQEFRQGKTDYLEGRYEDAIRHYQRAMALKPSAKLHYNIGLAYQKLDQPARALEAYRAYLKAEPAAANAEEVRRRIADLERQPGPSAPAPVLVTPRQPPPPPAVPVPDPTPGVQPPPSPSYWSGAGAQTVVVSFGSTPPGAILLVDGRQLGITPLSLAMVAGATYRVQMSKPGYQPESAALVAQAGQSLVIPLRLTDEGRLRLMTRTEWFALEPVIGAQSGNVAVGLRVLAFGLRWRHLVWTIVEGGGHVGPRARAADLGTRLAYPLYLGERGQHQLRIGLGLGVGLVNEDAENRGDPDTEQTGLLLSPSLEYFYQGQRRFFVGASLRYATLAAGDLAADRRPHAVLLSVPLGWTSVP